MNGKVGNSRKGWTVRYNICCIEHSVRQLNLKCICIGHVMLGLG